MQGASSYEDLLIRYTPIVIMNIAITLCIRVFLEISSWDILGKRIVSNIPNINTNKGCNPLIIQTNVTGVSKEATLNDIFATILIISFRPFISNTCNLFVLNTWINPLR